MSNAMRLVERGTGRRADVEAWYWKENTGIINYCTADLLDVNEGQELDEAPWEQWVVDSLEDIEAYCEEWEEYRSDWDRDADEDILEAERERYGIRIFSFTYLDED